MGYLTILLFAGFVFTTLDAASARRKMREMEHTLRYISKHR